MQYVKDDNVLDELQLMRKHHLQNEGKDIVVNNINDEIVTNLSINNIPTTNQVTITYHCCS